MSVRHSYAQQTSPSLARTISNNRRFSEAESENAFTRDLRVFGGVLEDEIESSDLRGPMLDVVLGLFDGIDYDDDLC